ncbi:MAG: hypothetical protein J6Y78_15990 [Paludibacteraceae bacterium]|nr:hypothetical protein [Paludibacteraceae bacterium]
MTKEEIEKIAWNYLVDQAEGCFEDDEDIQYAYLITEKVANDCSKWSIGDEEEVKSYVDSCWAWHTVENGKLIKLRD